MKKIIISTDKQLLDVQYICDFLKSSYWASNRTDDQIMKSIKTSLCFGMYLDNNQIGFARIVTDEVVFSYLMDVFIDDRFRHRNLGSDLLEAIYNHHALKNVENNLLRTADAQEFYKRNGFKNLDSDGKSMIKISV